VNPTNPIHPDYFKRVQATEKTNAVTISSIQVSTASQIEAAFGVVKQERAGALIVLGDPFFCSQARRIAELASQHRLHNVLDPRTRGVLRIDELRTEQRGTFVSGSHLY